jgi:hypothetical protein
MMKIIRIIALELSRTLLKLAMDRELRKELPAIFKRLDLVLPYLIAIKPARFRCKQLSPMPSRRRSAASQRLPRSAQCWAYMTRSKLQSPTSSDD